MRTLSELLGCNFGIYNEHFWNYELFEGYRHRAIDNVGNGREAGLSWQRNKQEGKILGWGWRYGHANLK